MHDPETLILRLGPLSLWHRDRNGVDGACAWFMRASHGSREVLKAIERRFDFDWDRTTRLHDGTLAPLGFFDGSPLNWPIMSIHAIALNLFFLAAVEHFGGRRKAMRFVQGNLALILIFAENPCDSPVQGWMHRFGIDESETREDRIRKAAAMIYGWILRATRPWYRHPRWHVHHWRIQVSWPRWVRVMARSGSAADYGR